MKLIANSHTHKRVVAYFVCIVLIMLLFRLINYTGNEGFNPSDEGVVVAQSYRLVHGEVPHRDFVSIRPVGSGCLHTLHFISPLPLIESGRWFVVFQFMLMALACTVVVRRLTNRFRKTASELGLFMLLFSLSILNYNLFPWTTIDAVFWSSLAILVWFSVQNIKLRIFLAIQFLVLAAVSRQSFLLPAMIVSGLALVQFFLLFRLRTALFIVIMAWWPALIYIAVLLHYNAMPDFLVQMSGRTELLETGVLKYMKMLISSPASVLHISVVILFGVNLVARRFVAPLLKILNKHLTLVCLLVATWAMAMVVSHFLRVPLNIYRMPFELFFCLVDLLLLAWMLRKPSTQMMGYVLFILMIAHISSISLGDNTPVFACGLLMAGIVTLVVHLIPIVVKPFFGDWLLFIAGLLFLILGTWSQRRVNYRDLPANQLNCKMGEIHPNFGNVMSNANICAYYDELVRLVDSLPNSNNRIVVLPHNAIFYPMLNTRNPLPLDWMQAAEYIGSEQRIIDAVVHLCSTEGYYVLIDMYDAKKMHESTILLHTADFHYIDTIIGYCRPLQCNSKYVNVYTTGK